MGIETISKRDLSEMDFKNTVFHFIKYSLYLITFIVLLLANRQIVLYPDTVKFFDPWLIHHSFKFFLNIGRG